MFSLERLKSMVFILPAILIGLTIHEFAHAYTAYLFGDKSARLQGRLSLNPIQHIDITGFIFLVLFGFGWAKPVVYDPSYIEPKKRKLARCLIALAGPLSNLVIGAIFAVIYGMLAKNINFLFKAQELSVEQFLFYLVFYISALNFGLFVFNLIPIAPLDGSHLVSVALNLDSQQEYMYQRYGMMILMGLILSEYIIKIDLLPIGAVIQFLIRFFSGGMF